MAKRRRSESEMYERARRLLIAINEGNLPRKGFDQDLGLKKKLIKIYGYDSLKGAGKVRLKLEECTPARITRVFSDLYERSLTQVDKFETNARRDYRYQNLSVLLEAEKGLRGNDLVEARERTSITMDSAPAFVLKLLEEKYGKDTLGEYCVSR